MFSVLAHKILEMYIQELRFNNSYNAYYIIKDLERNFFKLRMSGSKNKITIYKMWGLFTHQSQGQHTQ